VFSEGSSKVSQVVIRILLHHVSTTSSCFRSHFSMPYPTSRGGGRGRSVGARGRGTARNSVSRRPQNPQPPQEPAFPMMMAFIMSLVSAVSSIMGTPQGSGSGGSGTGGQLGAPAPGRIPLVVPITRTPVPRRSQS